MADKYLNQTGLSYFWSKIKAYIMSGASASAAGASGFVPAPAAGDNDKYLRGDGQWETPTNTTYTDATQSASGLMSAADKIRLDGMLELVYPIGSIYMSVNATDPSTVFGGSWQRIQDTFLLAAGSTYAAGSTGGEAAHTLTENELPELNGSFGNAIFSGGQSATATGIVKSTVGTLRQFSYNGTSTNSWKNYEIEFGGNGAHNNMPPYLAVYVWQRIA